MKNLCVSLWSVFNPLLDAWDSGNIGVHLLQVGVLGSQVLLGRHVHVIDKSCEIHVGPCGALQGQVSLIGLCNLFQLLEVERNGLGVQILVFFFLQLGIGFVVCSGEFCRKKWTSLYSSF